MESQTRHLLDYEGREIRLTTERLAHILSHPEMVGMEARVEEALREPERVIQSPSDPGVHLYYRRYFDTPVGDKILCIVVKVEVEDPFIITAYLADRVRHGRVLWESAMGEKQVKVWYDPEGDFLEVIFEQREGYFRETEDDRVMEKVDSEGNVLGFSILGVGSLKGVPIQVALS